MFEFQFELEGGEQFTVPVSYDFESLDTQTVRIGLDYAGEDAERLTAAFMVLKALEGRDIHEDSLHGLFDAVHGILQGDVENVVMVGADE